MEKARQWGLRCLHEKKMHAHNAYVTLTYNDECLPPGGTLVVRDVQLFMKRLRKSREPEKVRFFCGGEYGDANKRPHYHALLFNCRFPDARLWTQNKRGESLYVSDELAALWGLGHCSIGEVTFDSAVYCAKYALKKVNGELSGQHYEVIDGDGVVFDRVPEFAIMSRRPGIGAGYYDKYGAEVRNLDSVVVEGREVRPPRYYDVRSERIEPDKYVFFKRKRKRLAVLNRFDNTSERLRVKERLMEIAAEKKERSL
ncbi:MAG: replication initiator protein [Microviridae sp.]|nr:MAG: replication initiator protein [Microviridae sp.]